MKTLSGTCLALLIGISAMPTYAGDKLAEHERRHPKASAVPEINVSNAGVAIALLSGVVAIAREARKRT